VRRGDGDDCGRRERHRPNDGIAPPHAVGQEAAERRTQECAAPIGAEPERGLERGVARAGEIEHDEDGEEGPEAVDQEPCVEDPDRARESDQTP